LLVGLPVASVPLFTWRRARGVGGFPVQPGHWLLFVEGVSALLSWCGTGVYYAFALREERPILWEVVQLPNYLWTLVAYGVAFQRPENAAGVWKLALGGLILQYALLFLVGATLFAIATPALFPPQGSCFASVNALLLLLAATVDPQRTQRDFLHWAGVLALLLTNMLQVSFSYVMAYFLP
jgi:hypothetical protein